LRVLSVRWCKNGLRRMPSLEPVGSLKALPYKLAKRAAAGAGTGRGGCCCGAAEAMMKCRAIVVN
jgi:hypothetical protein